MSDDKLKEYKDDELERAEVKAINPQATVKVRQKLSIKKTADLA